MSDLAVTCERCGTEFTAQRATRRFCSRRCARFNQRPTELRACACCGQSYRPAKVTSRFCSPNCARTTCGRETAPQRGDTQRGRGEGRTYVKRDGRHEHRVVAERMIGRALEPAEVVHHVNGDRRDNRPENLQVMTRAEHSRMHTLERWEAQRNV